MSRGVKGPNEVTAEDANKYAGMATMLNIILARNESGNKRLLARDSGAWVIKTGERDGDGDGDAVERMCEEVQLPGQGRLE